MRPVLIFAAAGLAAAATACSPVVRTHGYVAVAGGDQPVEVMVDTRESVLERMGSPSTTGVFEDTWYYITSVREDFAYLRPLITDRRILAIRFDEDDRVAEVEELGLEYTNDVRLVSRTTPTRGRTLSFMEQLFGSVGALNPNQLPGRMDQIPDSAGGPDPY